MPITDDLKKLMRNKPFLYGAAGVAGIGAIVFIRRRGYDDQLATEETDAQEGYLGQFPTGATDVASWLSDYSGNLDAQLRDFLEQSAAGREAQSEFLTEALANQSETLAEALGKLPASISSAVKGAIPKTSTKKPAAKKPAPKKPAPKKSSAKKFVTVAKFTSSNPPWNSTLWGIAQHYGTSVSRLLSLNPSVKNANLIHPNQKIRVK